MALPTIQSDDQDLMLMQQKWAGQLNPFLAKAFLQGNALTNIRLVNGATTFNHFLGRQMQGWVLIDQDGAASIYRSQPMNGFNLTLTSTAAVTVNLWVF